jgi:putative tryptophan/tyrosine transport system substrate-binding protein
LPDVIYGRHNYRDFQTAARSSQIELIEARARSDVEIEAIVTSLGGDPSGGLVVTPDYFMFNHAQQIVSQAARKNVPTIYPWRWVVSKQDGLLSYGPDLVDIVRRSASYVDKIFRGEKPADLPVQVPVRFEVAVNVKTARVLGLAVPTSIVVARRGGNRIDERVR